TIRLAALVPAAAHSEAAGARRPAMVGAARHSDPSVAGRHAAADAVRHAATPDTARHAADVPRQTEPAPVRRPVARPAGIRPPNPPAEIAEPSTFQSPTAATAPASHG